jgi:hypothetical protein
MTGLRGRLLATTSGLILAAALAGPALAEGAGSFQIDLIGDWNTVGGGATQWTSDLPAGAAGNTGRLKPRGGFDGEADITWRPSASNWVFLGSVRYGRTNTSHSAVSQYSSNNSGYRSYYGKGRQHETHLMVDFQAGRDVGLGMFGKGSSSILAAGVRFVHFTSTTTADFSTYAKYRSGYVSGTRHRRINRLTTGAGPMVSWKTNVPLSSGFAFRFGASGALLVTNQIAKFSDVFTAGRFDEGLDSPTVSGRRSSTRLVPEPAAYAALAFTPRGSALSIAVGYRVDAYFGVLDGGFDTAHRVDRVLAGPFVDLSVKFK